MIARYLLLFALVGISIFSCGSNREPMATNHLRAVSLAGAEFGTHKVGFSSDEPGVFDQDYTWNSKESVDWFAERGVAIFRIPFRWERLQPELMGPLDPKELARLKKMAGWVSKSGGKSLLDLHNYGRYFLNKDGEVVEAKLGSQDLPEIALVNFWQKLASEFAGNPSIYGYGIMNEPHDLALGVWKSASQAVVTGIREIGDHRLILVAGDRWSNSEMWVENNGQHAWIEDSANALAYEAHCYFDFDASGQYRTGYNRELRLDPDLEQRAQQRLQPFINWCRTNKVRGFLGEIGVPSHEPRWEALLKNALSILDMAEIPSCYWAAGEWWGEYPLSIQPKEDFSRSSHQTITPPWLVQMNGANG